MKTHPYNFLILAGGVVLYILFHHLGYHALAYASWIAASIIFCIKVLYNRNRSKEKK